MSIYIYMYMYMYMYIYLPVAGPLLVAGSPGPVPSPARFRPLGCPPAERADGRGEQAVGRSPGPVTMRMPRNGSDRKGLRCAAAACTQLHCASLSVRPSHRSAYRVDGRNESDCEDLAEQNAVKHRQGIRVGYMPNVLSAWWSMIRWGK
jgi:hypothetical protein